MAMQHNAHMNTRIDWILRQIEEALGISRYDLADWYLCGDELR